MTAALPGVEVRDLPSGARYLKLHHFADPDKGEAWLERVRREMSDTPFEFRREILMEDVRAKGALWKRDWFHRFGFRYPPCLRKSREHGVFSVVPDEIVKVVITASSTSPAMILSIHRIVSAGLLPTIGGGRRIPATAG